MAPRLRVQRKLIHQRPSDAEQVAQTALSTSIAHTPRRPRRLFGARLCEPQHARESSAHRDLESCQPSRRCCGSQTRAPSVAASPRCAVSPTASRRCPGLPTSVVFGSEVRGLATRETAGWAACATTAQPDSTPLNLPRSATGLSVAAALRCECRNAPDAPRSFTRPGSAAPRRRGGRHRRVFAGSSTRPSPRIPFPRRAGCSR